MAKRRIAISLHNLSSSKKSVRRAGIQQVVLQVAREVLTNTRTDLEFVPIFHLPLCNPENTPLFRPTHFNASKLVLEETLKELDISKEDLIKKFPFIDLLFKEKIDEYEKECINQIASCDIFFETALADVRNVTDAAKKINPSLLTGICVHDMVPIVYPEYIDDHMRGWFSIQYIECLHSVDFCVGVSRHTAIDTDRYMANHAPSKERIYYNALPTPKPGNKPSNSYRNLLVTAYPQLQGKSISLSVATIEPRKNISLVLKAYKKFIKLFPELAKTNILVLIGAKGWENHKQIDQLIADLGSNVLVTGYVSDELLDSFYHHANTCLMPSHYEGFGIPVADARGRGAQVITCVNSSLPEASRLDAYYTDPSNEDELACLIATTLRHPNKNNSPTNKDSLGHQNWTDYFNGLIEILHTVTQTQTTTKTQTTSSSQVKKIGFDLSQDSVSLRRVNTQQISDIDTHHSFIARITGSEKTFDIRSNRRLAQFYQNLEQSTPQDLSVLPNLNQEHLYFDSLSHFVLSSRVHINSNPALTNALKKNLKLISLVSKDSAKPDQYLASIVNWSDLMIFEDEDQLGYIDKNEHQRCLVRPELFKPTKSHIESLAQLIGGLTFA